MTGASGTGATGTAPTGGTDPPFRQRGIWLAELATPLVSIAMALGAARLFSTSAPIPRLLVVVLAAHAIGTLLRRIGVGVAIALLGSLVGAVLIISWLYLGDSLSFGIPTGETLDAAVRLMRSSFGGFRTSVAPVAPSVGFELVMALGLYWLATFCDLATFRGAAPFQAVLPHIATFAAISIFARGLDATVAATLLTAAILIHLGCHRAAVHAQERWADDSPTRGTMMSVRSLLAIVVGAMALGALASPLLPGAGTEPLVDLLKVGRGNGPVEVSNPLVGISNLLGNQSDAELFRVSSKSPHYWRITALENYDAKDGQWKTRRSYRDISSGDELRPVGGVQNPIAQDVTVSATNVPGIWLPSPFSANRIEADKDLRYDPDTASIIISGASAVPSITYSVTAAIPQIDPATAPVLPVDTSAVTSNYSTTAPTSPVASQLLDDLGQAHPGASQFGLAQALQAVFRSDFRYSTNVDYSAAPVPIDAFLTSREGFCQQFASAFALLARQLGIPSRIGVGFTWGETVGTADDGTTTYVVRGRHAHAWPELYFDRLGWVTFEPTPGRGNPDAVSYGGVAPQQAAAPGAPAEATAPTTTVVSTGPGAGVGGATTTAVPTTLAPSTTNEAELTPARRSAATNDPLPWWLGSLVIALLAMIGLVATLAVWAGIRAARSAARRRGATTAGARVALAWETSIGWLADAGVHRKPWETPHEFSSRSDVSSTLGPDQTAALQTIATIETTRIHAADGVTDTERAQAESSASQIASAVSSSLSRGAQLRRALGIQRRPT